MAETLRITRFHTVDGQSQFQDIDVAYPDSKTDAFGHVLRLSRDVDGNAMLAVLPGNLDQDWHNAPNRQFVIVLAGALEVEIGNGECRRFESGDLFFADDTDGQGHRTRAVGGPVRLLFVRLADDFDPVAWAAA